MIAYRRYVSDRLWTIAFATDLGLIGPYVRMPFALRVSIRRLKSLTLCTYRCIGL